MRVKRRAAAPVLRDRRFAAVVLAAGAGRRFGGAKLTTPWRGGRLIDGALNAAFRAPAERVIVTLGADAAVGPAAMAFAEALGEADRLQLVAAPDWAEGLSASLRAGLDAVPGECEAAFLFLGDMPELPSDIAMRLAAAWAPGVAAIAPVFEGRPGHPALLGAGLFPRAMALRGDAGARALMETEGERFVRLAVTDPGVVFDVDTPEAQVS